MCLESGQTARRIVDKSAGRQADRHAIVLALPTRFVMVVQVAGVVPHSYMRRKYTWTR